MRLQKMKKRIQVFFVMKKQICSAALSFALMVALTGQAVAAEGPRVTVDDNAVEMTVQPELVQGKTYVPYLFVVREFYPNATATWENGGAMVRDAGLELFMQPDTSYLVCNGRYLYVPDKIYIKEGEVMVPLRTLCQALGVSVGWDAASSTAILTAGTEPILSGDAYYDSDMLYWLSHIINAESGNQPLQGKIAVGNVVMNRVASSIFPNSVRDVIYQRNQFTPVQNGSIKLKPNAESIVAAKLVLDGANTAGNSLYFVNPKASPNSWASRNRPYVATIGAHAFFA